MKRAVKSIIAIFVILSVIPSAHGMFRRMGTRFANRFAQSKPFTQFSRFSNSFGKFANSSSKSRFFKTTTGSLLGLAGAIALTNNTQTEPNESQKKHAPRFTKVVYGVRVPVQLTPEQEKEIMSSPLKPAVIEEGIVKGSTHYSFINLDGGKTVVHSAIYESPIEVWHKPTALFHRYCSEEKIRSKKKPYLDEEYDVTEFLGKVEVDAPDKQTIEKLNTLIDPQSKAPVIKKAKISHCVKAGRYITFYDEKGEVAEHCYHYNGSIDIKAEKDRVNMYPSTLLDQLEEVTEIKPHILELFGWPPKIETLKYK